MSHRLLQLLVYPESGREKEKTLGTSHMSAGRTELTPITLDPRLTEIEGCRREQGYCIMLPCNAFVRVFEYLFHLIYTGSCHANGNRLAEYCQNLLHGHG